MIAEQLFGRLDCMVAAGNGQNVALLQPLVSGRDQDRLLAASNRQHGRACEPAQPNFGQRLSDRRAAGLELDGRGRAEAGENLVGFFHRVIGSCGPALRGLSRERFGQCLSGGPRVSLKIGRAAPKGKRQQQQHEEQHRGPANGGTNGCVIATSGTPTNRMIANCNVTTSSRRGAAARSKLFASAAGKTRPASSKPRNRAVRTNPIKNGAASKAAPAITATRVHFSGISS